MRGQPAAMEMALLWKSQNDFHSSLEISPGARDSHIPTADPRHMLGLKTKTTETKVSPMYPV
jgi:hypothetical protein